MGAIVIMLRQLKMHGMTQAVGELTEQGSPAFEAAVPILSQLLNISAYYSTIAEGVVLLVAVILGSLSGDSTLWRQWQGLRLSLGARRRGTHVSQRADTEQRLPFVDKAETGQSQFRRASFLERNGSVLRYALPAYAALMAVLLVSQFVLGNTLLNPSYWNAFLVLSSFLIILALGQGAVILTGGLDLSIPWIIGLSGILLAGIVEGSNAALIYAVPAVLLVAILIGIFNGLGVVALGLSPIVVTLAANGILQGIALLYSGGTPSGFAAPVDRRRVSTPIGAPNL